MELSSGDEFYIVCDNIGIFFVVFSGIGLMIKQILYIVYGEIYMDINFNFQIIIGYYGGFYDSFIKFVYMGRRDYDVLVGRWISLDYELWKYFSSSNIMFFNFYMFKNNNFISNFQDIKCFMIGEDWGFFKGQDYYCFGYLIRQFFLRKLIWGNRKC